MKAITLTFVLAIILNHNSIAQKITVPSPFTKRNVKQNDTVAYAIIKYNKHRDRYIFKNVKAATLNKQEIIEIEKLTSSAVSKYKRETNDNMRNRNLSSYYRQYVAVINSHGEKEVWVNCFCAVDDNGWTNHIVQVDDGGSCYFNLKINLTRKKYSMFGTNGLA